MAVQVCWQDGVHQWLPGKLYQGRDHYHDCRGFTRYRDGFTICHNGKDMDFASDVSVISMCLDQQVIDWSRRKVEP